MVQHFADVNFAQEVIEASKEKPVLVDFSANWCAPCKIQGPIVEEIAEEIGDRAIVGEVDLEVDRQIADQYGIMSIPTLMIFKNGGIVEKMVGLQYKEALMGTVKKYI
jgi:thioredoxin 1